LRLALQRARPMVQLGFEKGATRLRVAPAVGAGLTIGRDCEKRHVVFFFSVHDLV
jgi:hypothetical protein